MEFSTDTKRRRSKRDNENRNYSCECGKKYLSYQALYTHKKSKHFGTSTTQENRSEKKVKHKPQPASYKEETQTKVHKVQAVIIESSKSCKNFEINKTCDEAFKEYLKKMRKKINDEQFATLKCCMYALRECLNKNYEKVDPNYFLCNDLYTVTEKPNLIPNVYNYFIFEYLPSEYRGQVKTDEVHFIFEFCNWLNKKNYTDLEIALID
jgi:hypothetical protein